MKTILQENNQYVLRFDKKDEILSSLKEFCERERIDAGFFHGLGACGYLKLACYDLATKKYLEKEFNHSLEIASLTGDISTVENEVFVHMHGTFSDEDLQAVAGHVLEVVVSATCEMMITKFSQPMPRKFNPETSLKLLD